MPGKGAMITCIGGGVEGEALREGGCSFNISTMQFAFITIISGWLFLCSKGIKQEKPAKLSWILN